MCARARGGGWVGGWVGVGVGVSVGVGVGVGVCVCVRVCVCVSRGTSVVASWTTLPPGPSSVIRRYGSDVRLPPDSCRVPGHVPLSDPSTSPAAEPTARARSPRATVAGPRDGRGPGRRNGPPEPARPAPRAWKADPRGGTRGCDGPDGDPDAGWRTERRPAVLWGVAGYGARPVTPVLPEGFRSRRLRRRRFRRRRIRGLPGPCRKR